MNSDSREQFETLWTNFLEGELDDAETDLLRELLTSDEELRQMAIELYQTHRLLGLLIQEESTGNDGFIEGVMSEVLRHQESFDSRAMKRVREQAQAQSRSAPALVRQRPVPSTWHRKWMTVSMMGISLLMMIWLAGKVLRDDQRLAHRGNDGQSTTVETVEPPVKFSRVAKARFFGELTPAADSTVTLHQSYVLMSGMVELLFPGGAQAIIEGPAVFEAQPDNCLAVNLGRCSVHAPDGAEGFRVETPDTRVVDRGTRFTVDVSEFNETKIQVVEGIADIYKSASPRSASRGLRPDTLNLEVDENEFATTTGARAEEVRLRSKEAIKVLAESGFIVTPEVFDAQRHRMQLPDRVVSYTATLNEADGKSELLETVTVQRGGEEVTYAADDLIPVELIGFRVSRNQGRFDHVLGGEELVGHPAQALADHSLVTGVINPGGSVASLQSSPVLNSDPENNVLGTPGMAVRFARPVKNGPGPDIVFFEIHPLPSPADGDAFHVSPLQLTSGKKSHTIREYDLSVNSPEALPVTRMLAHEAERGEIESLAALQKAKFSLRPVRLEYRALAVGIDLSDLGYAPGEEAEGLFIQDAEDNDIYVDPVLIGGLP
ncbi:MAG: hypothetical protein WDZ51_00335 [Pirellulaceae bacterium]